jgi:Na+:H+ antiporter
VPMFARLTSAQLDTIAHLLRPRFAVPGELLIRDGDRADAMYFISSGRVEVEVVDQKLQLKPGDFFGEMALVSGGRRRGNVHALGYCQLLALKEVDFQNLLRSDREIETQITAIASARVAMNERAGPKG